MKTMQKQETAPAVQGIDLSAMPPLQPGEPMLFISLNERVLSFPVRWARWGLFLIIPPWLRDSTVDTPEPEPGQAKAGVNKHVLDLMRSGIKNLVRPFLPLFLKGIYGPDTTLWPQGIHLPHGREDVLPIIDQMLIDFVITQAFHHPLVVSYDEQTGLVKGIRPGQRVAPTDHTGNAPS